MKYVWNVSETDLNMADIIVINSTSWDCYETACGIFLKFIDIIEIRLKSWNSCEIVCGLLLKVISINNFVWFCMKCVKT